ncbi:class I SAM-dependent methyltransferase [Paraflavitalea soli]|uniref:Class I SAM-dependent methyltransferase n=1 Tax=Paraflavitalea soli TaxID=2315862 RepID=A0A3B7MYU6_9BACT|nr:class I SAM-dependent methyltransferase [Paraflavitalea soli]AXY78270.1 class I SAM-dependent methyltransferase [Paraflavitalea soli]
MFSPWQLAKKYIHYYFTASNGKGHGVHSPFVFEFIKKVLNDKRHFAAYDQVEALRKQLLADNTCLQVEDLGAGSAISNTSKRPIARIAKYAAKSTKFSQLLFRIVQYYKPATILELGTSLGISASYMALANPAASVITGEGSIAIAEKAAANFRQLAIPNIELVPGNFDNTLPQILARHTPVELAFLDGNHRLEPTLRYFEALLLHTTEHSILILDDIHWSEEMEQAWQQVQDHPAVTLTIDLFFIGLVFFRKDFKVKQHFSIRF